MTRPAENPLSSALGAGRILIGIYHGYPAEGIIETIGHDNQLQSAQRSIDEAALRTAVKLGYQLLSCGGDVLFLRAGSRAALERSRQTLGELGQSKKKPSRIIEGPSDSTLRRKVQNV